ncbi:unnamed protein product, partial [marine sediment metagenome]
MLDYPSVQDILYLPIGLEDQAIMTITAGASATLWLQ